MTLLPVLEEKAVESVFRILNVDGVMLKGNVFKEILLGLLKLHALFSSTLLAQIPYAMKLLHAHHAPDILNVPGALLLINVKIKEAKTDYSNVPLITLLKMEKSNVEWEKSILKSN